MGHIGRKRERKRRERKRQTHEGQEIWRKGEKKTPPGDGMRCLPIRSPAPPLSIIRSPRSNVMLELPQQNKTGKIGMTGQS